MADDVVCRDLPFGEPVHICAEDGGDEPASAIEELRVALDLGRAIDDVEDRVDAVRVGLSQRPDSIRGADVVRFLGAQAPCLAF